MQPSDTTRLPHEARADADLGTIGATACPAGVFLHLSVFRFGPTVEPLLARVLGTKVSTACSRGGVLRRGRNLAQRRSSLEVMAGGSASCALPQVQRVGNSKQPGVTSSRPLGANDRLVGEITPAARNSTVRIFSPMLSYTYETGAVSATQS